MPFSGTEFWQIEGHRVPGCEPVMSRLTCYNIDRMNTADQTKQNLLSFYSSEIRPTYSGESESERWLSICPMDASRPI